MSPQQREAILPKFSLERRVTVLVLLLATLVVGTIATLGIPLELIPRGYEDPSLHVRAFWNNAPSPEVLDKVTIPLEEELSSVAGLQNIFTFSTTGFASCYLSFKLGTDMDVAYREVRDRIERAKARMPDEVDRVLVQKYNDSAIPVFAMGLAIDSQLTDSYSLIQNQIVLPLQRIDGVASVDTQGLQEKEILIELDRGRTAAAGLNIFELGQLLEADNFTLASGNVEAGGKKLLLRSVARYADVEALENRMIAPSVRLGDVATVKYDMPEKLFRVRAMSQPAAFMMVFKEGEANAIEVSRRIAAAVEEMGSNPRLADIGLTVFFDQGDSIKESLGTLLDSGRIGAIFAAVVLFLFLRRLRMTLIITLSIPLSVLIALTAMYFAGETLNVISLLGLMISVGLLVDNSIVVAENIYRLHRNGLPRRTACIRGAGEISLAIVMATLTTIIVFLPVSLVEGQGQFFMLRLALPITVSLIASLLVALVFIPLAAYITLPARGGHSEQGSRLISSKALHVALRHLYERTMDPLNRGYNRMLAFFLRRRLDLAFVLVGVAAASAAGPFSKIEVVEVQEEERGGFEIDIELPQTTTLEEAEEYFLEIEEIIEAKREELDIEGYFLFHRSSRGEVQGWFANPRTNDLKPREVTERVLAALPEKAGVKVFTGDEREDEKSSRQVQMFTLTGEDSAQLETVARQLEELFTAVPGVLGVKKNADPPAEELGLVLDRDRAQRMSLNPEAVAGVVRNALGGRALPKFYREGREIPVRVRFREEDRNSLAQLWSFGVPTAEGELVSLGSVTTPQRLEAPVRIVRRNKQTSRTISLELEDGQEQEARKRLVAVAGRLDLPEGIKFGTNRRGSAQQEEQASAQFAIMLSIIFIYLLMGFLFESFVLPLSIVMTIPMAIVGVYWTHFVFGYNIDGLGMVGIILLIGVVVNNGIVLVDYINRLRREGLDRSQAILTSADRRFRPIMMTALTTVSGMVPLILAGRSTIGISYTSFGLTLIGGMTSATLLTLLVVPIAYTLFDDLRQAVTAVVRGRAKQATIPT